MEEIGQMAVYQCWCKGRLDIPSRSTHRLFYNSHTDCSNLNRPVGLRTWLLKTSSFVGNCSNSTKRSFDDDPDLHTNLPTTLPEVRTSQWRKRTSHPTCHCSRSSCKSGNRTCPAGALEAPLPSTFVHIFCRSINKLDVRFVIQHSLGQVT